MSRAIHRFWPPLLAILAGTYLGVMLLTGALPERRNMVRFEANGVLHLKPTAITRVTVSSRTASAVFARQGDGWLLEQNGAAVAEPLRKTLERAVKFMHNSTPVQMFKEEDLPNKDLAEFGLDRPSVTVTLENADGVVLTADFGDNDVDGILRYMRLRGAGDIYQMSGFVGKEWDAVARTMTGAAGDLGNRLFAFRETRIGQIDLFYEGRLGSFLRSPGGLWFLHDNSHRHNPGSGVLPAAGAAAADAGGSIGASPAAVQPSGESGPAGRAPAPSAPKNAPPTLQGHPEPDAQKAKELATAIDFIARTVYDRRIMPTEALSEYGLENPPITMIFYPSTPEGPPRSTPLAVLYVGGTLPSGLSYYARLAGEKAIAVIPLYHVNGLIKLAFGIDPTPPPPSEK